MIKHIVLFRFTENLRQEQKRERTNELRAIFSPLHSLPSVREYRVGINISNSEYAFDVAIDSTFDSPEDLKTYQESPEHRDAISRAKKFDKEKSVVDYEFQP